MKLADQGYFWVGIEHKKMPYGTILAGQMFVQYLHAGRGAASAIPSCWCTAAAARALHYMGVGGEGRLGALLRAGRLHASTSSIVPVTAARRIIPTRSGPIGASVRPTQRSRSTSRAPRSRSPTSGGRAPATSAIRCSISSMAGQNAAPQDNVLAQTLWASRGAELLDKIGPAIVLVHSAGGPFGWLVANERPSLVKAIVNVEGAAAASPRHTVGADRRSRWRSIRR